MIPISFGPCFGWLHPGRRGATRGIVLCGAHPFEQLSAHRAWRDLACSFAELGYPTLRFDYPGTGDSLDPDGLRPVSCWIDSVRAAMDWMRANSGAERLILVGLRLGAAIAAEAAAQAPEEVDGLALLAPVVSGAAYLRELAATAALAGSGSLRAKHFELGGFTFDEATTAAIRRIDLTKLPRSPARRVLLLSAPPHSGDRLAQRLRAQGAEIDAGPFEGLSEFLEAPTFSQPPADAFARLRDWLSRRAPSAPGPVALVRTPTCPPLAGSGFVEAPAVFGPAAALVGVLCRPVAPTISDYAVIFLNSGANPRVGWARATVDCARALARAGLVSLRMDIAGLGDSAPIPGRPAQVLYSLEARADVIAAVDWLETQGLRRAVVVGLCSGAHLAFHSALIEPRVAGLVMTNVQRFVWKDGDSLEVAMRRVSRSIAFYKRAILQPSVWKRLWRGEVAVRPIAAALAARSRRALEAKLGQRGAVDESASVRAGFEGLAQRGARVLAVFSEEDAGIDELSIYMGVGGRRLQRLPGARIAFIENADHNLTARAARDSFQALLLDFLKGLPAVETPEPLQRRA